MVSLSGQLAAGASAAQVSADLVRDLRASAGTVGVLAFGTGATLYYLIFYRSQLIPRWLSVWGVAGPVLCLTAGLLVFFQSIAVLSGTQVMLSLPIAVQEMVLAVWLIVQGLSPKAKPPRLIDQFCFLPPIIARSVFTQADPLARRARRREGSSMSPFSPSSGPAAAVCRPPVAATGASGLTRS